MKRAKQRKSKLISWIYPLLFFIATLCLGTGYAAIDSITTDIAGTLEVEVQEGIFITDVTYISNSYADTLNSKIKLFTQTMLESTVALSTEQVNSTITYEVTIYNSNEQAYEFAGVKYDSDFYSNENIGFG